MPSIALFLLVAVLAGCSACSGGASSPPPAAPTGGGIIDVSGVPEQHAALAARYKQVLEEAVAAGPGAPCAPKMRCKSDAVRMLVRELARMPKKDAASSEFPVVVNKARADGQAKVDADFMLFKSKQRFDAMTALMEDGSQAADHQMLDLIADAVEAGELLDIEAPTRFEVIDVSLMARQLRILDGPHQGVEGWIQFEHMERMEGI